MIHYHGLPITPESAAYQAVNCGHAFVSFAHPQQLGLAIEICQSFAIDNGAFSAWKSGKPVKDWTSFYEFANECLKYPHCDFIIIPDVIDGSEKDNDTLLIEIPISKNFAVPDYPRIALGSSGEFAQVGANNWWKRMNDMMNIVCDKDGRPLVKMHGLRMLNPEIFSKLPISSADSTNIARNIGIDQAWTGSYQSSKNVRALRMRERIEGTNSANLYTQQQVVDQMCIFSEVV